MLRVTSPQALDLMCTRILQSVLRLVAFAACLAQTACLGTTTPEIQEFWAAPGDAQSKVQSIVGQVRCELAEALWNARHRPDGSIEHKLDFLDTWGAQVIFSLSVDEKSTLSPGLSVISPLPTLTTNTVSGAVTSMQNFTGSVGGSYSNEGTALDKTTIFYKVRYLTELGADLGKCPEDTHNGILFANSDLGIRNWLYRNLAVQVFKNSDLTLGDTDNVLSRDVKFEIVTSGNATPTWKLVRFTGNTTNPFFSISRDRYEEVLITMGRANKIGGGLDTPALISSLASQISPAAPMNNR